MYRIQFFGYGPSQNSYRTKKEARKVLAEFKKEDKNFCRTRYRCDKCGLVINRDYNAAINIENCYINKVLSVGL